MPIRNGANSCEQAPVGETVTRDSDGADFTAFTDARGGFWALFATDSGFEGITAVYILNATIVATPL